MPSLSSVIPHLKAILLGLLMVLFYALEANVAARLSVNIKETSSSTKMAKDGCKDRCGDVIIPYPFGMDTSNCYRDISYKITCAKSYRTRYPVASLNTSLERYEVSKITLDYIQINMVVPLTCNTTNFSDIRYHVPFPVSNTLNKLTVFGCNVYGCIKSQTGLAHESTNRIENHTILNSKGKGCKSSCDRSTRIPAISCSGDGCCKTEIPKGLTSYSIQTTGIVPDSTDSKRRTNSTGFTNPYAGFLNKTKSTGSVNPCVRAFLIDQGYPEVGDLLKLQMYLMYDSFVPVILDWAISDPTTCKEAQRNSSSYACGRNSYCIESQNGPGYQCKCSIGYEGNPYLPRGCQDVDECKEPHNKCGKGVICTNTQGSYNCTCPPDKIFETHEFGNYCRPGKQSSLADQKNKRRLHIFVIASSGIGVTVVIVLLLGIGYCLHGPTKGDILINSLTF
ncbi:hypothetical protein MKW98_020292 [Papaver atlanticum]|uniref:EGF-like domain-containing protein n=1 Tax=Papaver atlanticum TaxID=357466 RepID=A0AAD4TE86_9MAGN|nr:hypothetical protein MKW98_020292 [Papaver atlanticum]